MNKTHMHKHFFALLLSICFFSSTVLATQNNEIAKGIQKIIQHANKSAHIGIYVQSINTNQVLYTKNADALFTPASVQKLLTTTAALIYLKPHFRFNTTLRISGKIEDHQLNGNVYFQFSGDPSFTDTDLNKMIEVLRSKQIQTINGDIIIDNTAYDDIPYPPGWLWDDLSYDFAAPLKTIIINNNKFVLTFSPADRAGEKPTLSTALPLNTIHITNDLRTTTKYEKDCPITIYSDLHNDYQIKGCLPKQRGEQVRSLAIRNPLFVLKAIMAKQLTAHQIDLLGKIKTGETAPHAHVVYVHQSAPLSHLIVHLLKTSDNLYASTLLKKIGQTYYHTQGSWQNGLRAVKAILTDQAKINMKAVRVNDGAGLSRYNLLSPACIGKLLDYIAHHPEIRTVMWNALPIAGVDGTLRFRMNILSLQKKLRAKTGTMTSATSLAGFAENKKYGLLAFVIMVNGFVGKNTAYVHLENRIGEFLVKGA